MKALERPVEDPDMLEEYDFSGGERGKYAARYAKGTNLMLIDPDVLDVFPDEQAVNAALRALAGIVRQSAGSSETESPS